MAQLKRSLLVIHPYSFFDPGRFLEDALVKVGYRIDLYDSTIDFNRINQSLYDAVLFIESPYRPPVTVMNGHKIRLRKFYWILHGESRLAINLNFIRQHRIDRLLLATSPQLASKYHLPFHMLPMAVNPSYFPSKLPLAGRPYDISFVGSFISLYQERNQLLDLIKSNYPNLVLNFRSGVYLQEMGNIYGQSKIVFNWNYGMVLTMRMFEGMAAGALLLTNKAIGMEMLGQDGAHYVVYNNPADLLKKIQLYLGNLTKAQQIATLGLQKVIAEHTYEHRAYQLDQILQRSLRINSTN